MVTDTTTMAKRTFKMRKVRTKKKKSKKQTRRGAPKKVIAQGVDLGLVKRLAEAGATDKQVAAGLDISERTVNRYKQNEEFLAVLKAGKEKADEMVAASLFQRAIGYDVVEVVKEPVLVVRQSGGKKETLMMTEELKVVRETKQHIPGHPTAQIFWLTNRLRKEWKQRQLIGQDNENPFPQTRVYQVPRFNDAVDNGTGK